MIVVKSLLLTGQSLNNKILIKAQTMRSIGDLSNVGYCSVIT